MILGKRAGTPILLTALLVVAGCGPTVGQPAPSASAFPPRPVDVAVAEIDPCTVFDRDQQRRLTLRKATPARPVVNGVPSPGCAWLGSAGVDYNTQTIGVDAALAADDPAATVTVVNGFGAVQSTVRDRTGGAPTCQVTIDAAQRQSIRVQAIGDLEPRRSDEEMCRLATDAASMVMTTVVGAAGG